MTTILPPSTEVEVLNLTASEYDSICTILGRIPNPLEMELFSVLWSEHACYKNSLKWLRILPTSGKNVLVEAFKEDAGVVDIGNGYACVVKIESYNQPCGIQPRLGAFTGLRIANSDIYSKGAKPVAFLNSLRFGAGERDTARWLFNEVVMGLGEFEKGVGIPIVGGEVFFCNGYNTSPVVNNMTVGIVPKRNIISGVAKGKGNYIAVIGALTGADGINEGTFAEDFLNKNNTKGISLSDGTNVSIELALMDAVELLNERGLIVGLKAVGNQGIAGAASEMAAKGESGIKICCEKVPLRDPNLDCREVLFSQTWGRLLLCFKPEDVNKVNGLLQPLNIAFSVIGEVETGKDVRFFFEDKELSKVPAKVLGMGGGGPVYERIIQEPEENQRSLSFDDIPEPDHYPNVIKEMMNSLNIVSKKCLSNLFSQPFNNDSINTRYPSDASFIEVDESQIALAATIDGNPSYVKNDPFVGSQIAVAEASRNVVCGGGQPLALVDCLNFGSPHDPEAYWQFVQSVKGLSKAAESFKIPVVGGNVSFYNQITEHGKLKGITPAPVIGMVGVLKDKNHHTTLSFKHKGDMIFLIGKSRNDVNGSAYLQKIHGLEDSPAPYFNIEEEMEMQQAVYGLIVQNVVRSVHDISNGGLFFSLLESSIPLSFGFDITSDAEIRKDAFLFGEAQGRVVVSVAPTKEGEFVDFLLDKGISFSALGHVTKGDIRVDDVSFGSVKELETKFESCLEKWTHL